MHETRQVKPNLELPAKLREQMANDPVFSRDGWGRPDPDVADEDLEQPQPNVKEGSEPKPARPSAGLEEQPAPAPTEQKAADANHSGPARDDAMGNDPADSADLPGSAVRERSAPRDDREPHIDPSDDPAASEPEAEQSVERSDTPEHEFVDTPDDPRDMDTYRRIRETDDLDAVAANSGYPREIVEVAKENLFIRQHEVVVKPGDVRHGYFTPLPGVGEL
ncbi:hypothetical protein [Kribbella sp.]|uniref:hypothetical protein n=1 Tax=Kribbella sp. TaxID=1871183 RepID=UPI002D6B26C5|nr:hypothetical protein [Kribbella sp.]HZX03464.1 hypothetical protein [Kribbella sp.]